MIGRTIAHFEIVEKLGEGGMGVVYKARDKHLDRFVALKVLRPEAVADPDRRRRFVQEAKAASALSHPSIVHVYDIAEAEGALYITMEYVSGRTLDQLIRTGELSLQQVLRASVQAADALAAAHAIGIVHRDLKPANIMLTDQGLVKVLDFGLAKLVEPDIENDETRSIPRQEVRTAEGTVVGTAAYMSPEQAEGKKVDARSDIFSFGSVLYEMVTGRRAFSGGTRMATISMVMRDEPAPVSEVAPAAPAELERIVQRCMRKDPARRAQNMADVKVQLDELREGSASMASAVAPAPVPRRRSMVWPAAAVAILLIGAALYWWIGHSKQGIDSLAVLPFTNMGADPKTEYLSDGVTDSLTNTLAELPNLKVASRDSASRLKDADPKKVASDLGVRAVLTGKIRYQGDSLSISVELVDGRDSSHIWGAHYDRKMADLATVQQEITTDIAGKLKMKLSGEDHNKMARRYSANPEAYQLYLQGRYQAEKFTNDGLNKGIELMGQAITLDPNFALAYDGLSYAYWVTDDLFRSPKDSIPPAKQAALKALQLDETLPEAHVEMANVYLVYDYDWKAAEKEFKRAIELRPDYSKAHEYYAWYLLTVGRRDESIAESKRAVQLDPLSVETGLQVGWNLHFAHDDDGAIADCRRTSAMDPTSWFPHMILGMSLEVKGDLPGAVAEFQQARKLEPDTPFPLAELGHAYAVMGKKSEAQQCLKELTEWSRRSYVPQFNFASIYAGLGDHAKALTSLEKAYEDRSVSMTTFGVDPEFDVLHSEPRFKALLAKMGL